MISLRLSTIVLSGLLMHSSHGVTLPKMCYFACNRAALSICCFSSVVISSIYGVIRRNIRIFSMILQFTVDNTIILPECQVLFKLFLSRFRSILTTREAKTLYLQRVQRMV